ncbi:MAG: acetyltransferase [Solirubrobacterales bacterium]
MESANGGGAQALRDGTYRGGNDELAVELRIDTEEAGAISADLSRLGPNGTPDYVASLRSAPGERVSLEQGTWTVIAEDDLGANATGRLTLVSSNGDQAANAVLFLDGPLNGLPGRAQISFEAEWKAEAIRSLGVEIETEEGVADPVDFDFQGREVSIQSCLVDAGFEVREAGEKSPIPAHPQGWGLSELHTLMQDFAAAELGERLWELHLLMLARSDQEGLLGVMFDETEVLPRQGVAVFAEEIRARAPEPDRKLIQTTVHELGHALNLAHRFERVVGRADSTSFMNYDWRYGGGNKRDEFWSRFAFTFDPDELAFLRHAPRSAVIPGGAAFHSIRYWNEGTGGYSPYVPEAALTGFRLTLRPPQGGPLLSFAQPVFLEIELTNQTGEELELPPVLLDPKSGFLELLIRKSQGLSTRSLAGTEVFVPIVQRCFDLDPERFDTVPDGGSIRNNVNLTYGSSGFAFAEPGTYEVTALLAVPDRRRGRDLILRSETLPLRVATPKAIEEEEDAMDLFRDDVGVYLALGGNRGLASAAQALEAIRERRQAGEEEVRDPVVAVIVRAQGIDAGRTYVRYEAEDYRELEGDPEKAADLLRQLDQEALMGFDRQTAEGTMDLATSYTQGG